MSHHMQRSRRRNMNVLNKWILEWKKEHEQEPLDVTVLIRKAQLNIGCSKETAISYIEVLDPDLLEQLK